MTQYNDKGSKDWQNMFPKTRFRCWYQLIFCFFPFFLPLLSLLGRRTDIVCYTPLSRVERKHFIFGRVIWHFHNTSDMWQILHVFWWFLLVLIIVKDRSILAEHISCYIKDFVILHLNLNIGSTSRSSSAVANAANSNKCIPRKTCIPSST